MYFQKYIKSVISILSRKAIDTIYFKRSHFLQLLSKKKLSRSKHEASPHSIWTGLVEGNSQRSWWASWPQTSIGRSLSTCFVILREIVIVCVAMDATTQKSYDTQGNQSFLKLPTLRHERQLLSLSDYSIPDNRHISFNIFKPPFSSCPHQAAASDTSTWWPKTPAMRTVGRGSSLCRPQTPCCRGRWGSTTVTGNGTMTSSLWCVNRAFGK